MNCPLKTCLNILRKNWVAKRLAICAAALVLFLQARAQALGVGDEAPKIEAPFLQGAEQAADLRGHVVLIDVMASWCGPCRDELPLIEALYQKYKAQGVIVVGVGIDRKQK